MAMKIYSDAGFLVLLLAAGTAWIVFAYLQIRLICRAGVVARTQHRVPEIIPWMKRYRQAVDADAACQALERKRNIAAVAFLVIVVVEVALLTTSGLSKD